MQISLLLAPSEARKPTNTGRLLQLWLDGAQQHVRGEREHHAHKRAQAAATLRLPSAGPDQLAQWQQQNCWVLFPSPEAALLNEATPPTHLVVPDGSWSQTRRIVRRSLPADRFQHVQLENPGTARYALRRHGGTSLCTFEAVTAALEAWGHRSLAQELNTRFVAWHELALNVRAGRVPPADSRTL